MADKSSKNPKNAASRRTAHGLRSWIRRVGALFALYAKMDFAWLLRDTKTALIVIAAESISQIAGITGVFLIAWRFDGIGNMDRYEVLLLLGYATLLQGVYNFFFNGGNTGHLSRRIGRGQLEHMMIQPVPLGLQLITDGFLPVTGNGGLIAGIAVTSVAVRHIGLTVTPAWLLLFTGQLFAGLAVLVGMLYLGSVAAFYHPVAAEEITSDIYNTATRLSAFPLSDLSRGAQTLLVTALPAGLLAWFPTLVLLGRPPLGLTAAFPFLAASVLALLTGVLMKKGWLHYAREGSIRYSDVGHRR